MTMPSDPTPLPRRRRNGSSGDDDNAAAARLDQASPGPGELEAVEPEAVEPRSLHVRVPRKLSVVLVCPSCGETTTVEARLQARVTKDSDGRGALALRCRSPKSEHVCGQIALGLAEGPRER